MAACSAGTGVRTPMPARFPATATSTAVYRLDEDAKFLDAIPDTRGVLLRKDTYSYLEFFAVPEQ